MTALLAPRGSILIGVAPNGARKTRVDHPALPISPEELGETALACANAGAGLIHLHVRDDEGGHSLDPGRYREAISAIRERAHDRLVIQITTEAVGVYGVDAQMQAVAEVRPEACSAALRELCPTDSADDVRRYATFLRECRERDVWVQHILYDRGDVRRFNALARLGVFGERAFVLLVMGRYIAAGDEPPSALAMLVSDLVGAGTPDCVVDWAACGFGQAETRVLAGAAALGGHVRVGFENSLVHADGCLAESNAARVERIARLVVEMGLQPMNGLQCRSGLIA